MADLAWNDDLGFYVAVWQEAVPPPSGQVDGELWVVTARSYAVGRRQARMILCSIWRVKSWLSK